MNMQMATGRRTCFCEAARSKAKPSKPSTNSRAMKYCPLTSPKSVTWTILGWMSCAVSFASSMNIETKVLSAARLGRMRLMTSSFSKPWPETILALKTSAIPPVARRCDQGIAPELRGKCDVLSLFWHQALILTREDRTENLGASGLS